MMDMDGVKALDKFVEKLRRKEVSVLLVNVGHDNKKLMRGTGTLEDIGGNNILPHGICRGGECAEAEHPPDLDPDIHR
jgi:STAS domain